jgi:hypothetical protein
MRGNNGTAVDRLLAKLEPAATDVLPTFSFAIGGGEAIARAAVLPRGGGDDRGAEAALTATEAAADDEDESREEAAAAAGIGEEEDCGRAAGATGGLPFTLDAGACIALLAAASAPPLPLLLLLFRAFLFPPPLPPAPLSTSPRLADERGRAAEGAIATLNLELVWMLLMT